MSNLIGGLCATIRDNTYFGYYQISGTVTELGVPGQYPVVLYSRLYYVPVLKTLSTTAGLYQFQNIKYVVNGYFAVAFDQGSNLLNAAIADLITPEPMP